MKTYSILLAILLAGCSTTVPVVMKFPEMPPALNEKCAVLNKIEGDTVNIVDVHKTVVENYTKYYECAIKVEGWQEWYSTQKKIYESVK
ncbi:MAG: hypothetical protein RLZZ196_1637 [Bacteroidota bacterium]|jgi:hypothetical protein